MKKSIDFTIKNQLAGQAWSLTVYHYFTRSSHYLNVNSAVTLPLYLEKEGDYVEIFLAKSKRVETGACQVSLPPGINVRISADGEISFTYDRNRLLLRLLPGPPTSLITLTAPFIHEKPYQVFFTSSNDLEDGE